MNKSDIMKAAELSYEERVEAAAIAIANAAGSIITEFKGQSADFTELRRKQAKAALKAAGIDQLLKAAELLKQVEWQPIESAPKTGEVIILYGQTQHAEFPFVGQGHWYKVYKKWAWHHYIGDEPNQPTHWQPLPQPPVIIEKEGV